VADVRARALEVLRGPRRVLADVDLNAPAGSITCVIGPNGAGKSTLLYAIAGLLPYRGRIDLGGRDLRAFDPRERARALAYVPQRSLLEAPLAVETVIFQGRFAHTGALAGPSADDRRAVHAAMERTDVLSLAQRRFDRLSTGERRRVLIARALASEARTILLDEPTAALDVRHALELFVLLRALADEGFCIVVVLHALDDVRRHGDRALLLSEGTVVAEGAVRDVVDAERVRSVYGVTLIENSALAFELESK
jgi:iron complex transport system ATP-binding protein